MYKMKHTIIGGGNIGTLMAAEMANKGHEVIIYTPRYEEFDGKIKVFDIEDNYLFEAALANVTGSLKTAVENADVVWITVPSIMFREMSALLFPFIKKGQLIGVIPGSGGAEFAFKNLIEKGCVLFGFQRVHSIARLKKYGEAVYMLGRKKSIEAAAIPSQNTKRICDMIEKLFDMPCAMLPNYLNVTLTPSNPILHTARLYSMFKDYNKGMTYPKNYLFYEEWTDDSSEILLNMDEELQTLCETMPLDLSCVVSLRKYYDSPTIEKMTNKIKDITAFKGLTSPMIEKTDGWVPDFQSRYFTADFCYGLKLIKDLGDLYDVKMPNINLVWKWYEAMDPDNAENAFCLTCSKEELEAMYM